MENCLPPSRFLVDIAGIVGPADGAGRPMTTAIQDAQKKRQSALFIRLLIRLCLRSGNKHTPAQAEF